MMQCVMLMRPTLGHGSRTRVNHPFKCGVSSMRLRGQELFTTLVWPGNLTKVSPGERLNPRRIVPLEDRTGCLGRLGDGPSLSTQHLSAVPRAIGAVLVLVRKPLDLD